MITIIAQAAQAHGILDYVNGLSGIGSIVLAVVVLFRIGTGQDNERQVEPTAFAEIRSAQKKQTETLDALNREMGEVHTSCKNVEHSLGVLQAKQEKDIYGVHRRIDGLDKAVSSLEARTL